MGTTDTTARTATDRGPTETGPIDYVVVEFPGNRMRGEALPLLVDLVDRGIIRILDLVLAKRNSTVRFVGSSSPISTAMSGSTWPCSRAHRRGCSIRRTSTRPVPSSSRAVPPAS